MGQDVQHAVFQENLNMFNVMIRKNLVFCRECQVSFDTSYWPQVWFYFAAMNAERVRNSSLGSIGFIR